MACLILLALGMLVASMSTQDIRISTKIVGDKKVLAVAEQGIHDIMLNFDPEAALSAPSSTVTRSDGSSYTIGTASRPRFGSSSVDLAGFQASGWTRSVYVIDVTGTNPEYNTRVTIGVGAGVFSGRQSSGGPTGY